MKTSPWKLRFVLFALLLGIAVPSFAQHPTPPPAPAPAPPPTFYDPYAFLIGEWDFSPEAGGPAQGTLTFRWGPNRSYIWTAAHLLENGELVPHFEGMLVWNGVQKNLDMLISVDLNGGRVQEKGVVFVDPDGTVVREITATASGRIGTGMTGSSPVVSEGSSSHFRQTFRKAGEGRILTSVMRQTADGWVATFPGSDHLVMTRHPGAAS